MVVDHGDVEVDSSGGQCWQWMGFVMDGSSDGGVDRVVVEMVLHKVMVNGGSGE
jgi:hypothetical protein